MYHFVLNKLRIWLYWRWRPYVDGYGWHKKLFTRLPFLLLLHMVCCHYSGFLILYCSQCDVVSFAIAQIACEMCMHVENPDRIWDSFSIELFILNFYFCHFYLQFLFLLSFDNKENNEAGRNVIQIKQRIYCCHITEYSNWIFFLIFSCSIRINKINCNIFLFSWCSSVGGYSQKNMTTII